MGSYVEGVGSARPTLRRAVEALTGRVSAKAERMEGLTPRLAEPVGFAAREPGAAPEKIEGFTPCRVTIDQAWRVTSLSPEAAAWFGVEPAAAMGFDVRQILPVNRPVLEAMAASLVSQKKAWRSRVPSVLRPGLWIEVEVFPFAAGAAIFFWEAPGERPAQLTDNSSTDTPTLGDDAEEMALLDGQGVIVSVNTAWHATATALAGGVSLGVGALYCEACHAMMPDLDTATLRLAVSRLAEHTDEIFTHAYAVVTPRGPRLRQVRIHPLQVGGAARLLAIHEDLGEVARANAALRKTTEQLLSAQEVERERIAVELHDSTGQHLAALGLGLARLQRSIGTRREVQSVLDDMATSLQEAHREIRVLSYLLRTPSLLHSGLETTARRFVKGFGTRTGLHATYTSEGCVDVTKSDVQHAALRVIQEALSNVHRHAEATRVDVELANRDDLLTIRIADDGTGIEALRHGDLEDVALGVGIAGMRARVEQLGGALDIRCEGVGTVVTAAIPAPAPSEGPPGRRALPHHA